MTEDRERVYAEAKDRYAAQQAEVVAQPPMGMKTFIGTVSTFVTAYLVLRFFI